MKDLFDNMFEMIGAAAAWCSDGSDHKPWIQVDFGLEVHITALITQGRGDFNQWVEIYQVAESDDNKSWNLVTRGNGTTTKVSHLSSLLRLTTKNFNIK